MKLKGELMLMAFKYDFAVNGGAVGQIVLPQVAGNVLDGAKLLKAYAVAEDLASSGTPSVTFGTAASPTLYMSDKFAELESEGIARGANIDLSADSGDLPVMEIGTDPITSGVITLYMEILL